MFPPVGQPEGEELQTRGLEQEVAVLCPQLRHAGDPLSEGADDVNGAGQEVVELRDLCRLVLHQPGLGLQLLLLRVLRGVIKVNKADVSGSWLQRHVTADVRSRLHSASEHRSG